MSVESKRLYHNRKAAGLCPVCGGPPEPGRVMCRACADHKKMLLITSPRYDILCQRRDERRRKAVAERKAKGMCTVCGKAPVAEGLTRCPKCLEYVRTARKKYRARMKEWDAWQTSTRYVRG